MSTEIYCRFTINRLYYHTTGWLLDNSFTLYCVRCLYCKSFSSGYRDFLPWSKAPRVWYWPRTCIYSSRLRMTITAALPPRPQLCLYEVQRYRDRLFVFFRLPCSASVVTCLVAFSSSHRLTWPLFLLLLARPSILISFHSCGCLPSFLWPILIPFVRLLSFPVFQPAFAELRSATISFVVSVCLSVCLSLSHWTNCHEICILPKSVEKFKFN